MSLARLRYAVAGAALIAAGCAAPGDRAASLPAADSGAPVAGGGLTEIASTQMLGATDFLAPSIPQFQSTGTAVGEKVMQLRDELARLTDSVAQQGNRVQDARATIIATSQNYHGLVAAISARLQVGTTPGNPILVQQWNEAQAQLGAVGDAIARLNDLTSGAAADASVAAYLLESIRATYGLSGAVDADHRQLAVLEDEVNRTVVMLDRLLNELTEDVRRQNVYLATERNNLQTLSLAVANGELYGMSLANRAFFNAAPFASAAPTATAAVAPRPADLRPLVVIRFDREDVPYEQPLYQAIRTVLERRPESRFELVAVSPAGGNPARSAVSTTTSRRHAEAVLRALTQFGITPDRVTTSATTSSSVESPEVHVYVR